MKVFIGCSSRDNILDIYKQEASIISSYLAKKYDLVIGGIDGLMNIVIKSFEQQHKNIKIIGVKNYYDNIDNKYNPHFCKTVNQRKDKIIELSSLYVFLPGGIGSIDEIFSIIEAKRANLHNKKIIILNINNYYNDLLNFLDRMYKEKFADRTKELYTVINTSKEFIEYMDSYGDNYE